MIHTDAKTVVTTTVRKEIMLSEDQLEQLLIEEGCAKFNCAPELISVEFSVRSSNIEEVRIIFESTLTENGE